MPKELVWNIEGWGQPLEGVDMGMRRFDALKRK
jgi:hypothetical protein